MLEAVRLLKDRGVAVAQAARDLDVHDHVLRKWVREAQADPRQAFPGQGQMKPEQFETARKVYRTRDDARADMFDYFERFYNRRHRHAHWAI